MEKMAWDGPKWGREDFFPTDPGLANILGRTDLDFENLYSFHFLDPKFMDFQVPRFPKSGLGRAGLGPWATTWYYTQWRQHYFPGISGFESSVSLRIPSNWNYDDASNPEASQCTQGQTCLRLLKTLGLPPCLVTAAVPGLLPIQEPMS